MLFSVYYIESIPRVIFIYSFPPVTFSSDFDLKNKIYIMWGLSSLHKLFIRIVFFCLIFCSEGSWVFLYTFVIIIISLQKINNFFVHIYVYIYVFFVVYFQISYQIEMQNIGMTIDNVEKEKQSSSQLTASLLYVFRSDSKSATHPTT